MKFIYELHLIVMKSIPIYLVPIGYFVVFIDNLF